MSDVWAECGSDLRFRAGATRISCDRSLVRLAATFWIRRSASASPQEGAAREAASNLALAGKSASRRDLRTDDWQDLV